MVQPLQRCAAIMNDFIMNFLSFLLHLHGLWDFGSPTRDLTQALNSQSAESETLDYHSIP